MAFAFPVDTTEAINEIRAGLKKKYHDARHHCYAWVLNPDGGAFKTSDDREPSGTAGMPIFGQIRSRNLTNILLVVVRYFGGIKLGTGGLAQAYKIAASDALNKVTIIEKEVTEFLTLHYNYDATAEVMRFVGKFDLAIVDQSFGARCELKAALKVRNKKAALDYLEQLKVLGVSVSPGT